MTTDELKEISELTPHQRQLWEYADDLMYVNFKADNEAGVTRFLNDPSLKKKFSDDDRAFLFSAWLLIVGLDEFEYTDEEPDEEENEDE